jgi:hypothetical protein
MKKILINWDFMRFLRLGIGLWLSYAAITEHQLIIGVMAGLFLIQAIMNIGCGSKGCNVPFSKNNTNQKVEDISFEEVKPKQ